MKFRTLSLVALAALIVLSGCAPQRRRNPEDYGEAAPQVEAAIDALASHLQVDESEIEVASIEERSFPDTSLGVPEPGEMYAQVVTPGYEIILEVDGRAYTYHTSEDRVVRVPELDPTS